MKFRDYQANIIERGSKIILEKGFLYLAMEVRTGKTLTSLGIASKIGSSNVLFVTKKKAISSIDTDYKLYAPTFGITITNYESLHKVTGLYDLIVFDEAHCMGAFPKPSSRAKKAKDLVGKNGCRVILMSGTPSPESYCQLYHQVYFCPGNPFRMFKNFYAFAKILVTIKQKKFGGFTINDYKDGKKIILDRLSPYTISFSQKDAGFKVESFEKVLTVHLKSSSYYYINRLKKDLVLDGEKETVLADTAVKLMSKLHQMFSGTVKFESGNSKVLDYSKAEFIYEQFKNRKIGIFYKFKAELESIKEIYEDQITTDLDEFNTTNKSIALQIQSGREGISLKKADCLVYYNIDFSATSYWQSRDRMTTKDTKQNYLYWVFAHRGIEHKIYKAVTKKKDYTLSHFRKDVLTL
jgi:hypothetical protein